MNVRQFRAYNLRRQFRPRTNPSSMTRYAVDHSRGRIVLKAISAEHAIERVVALTPGSTGHSAVALPTSTPATQVARKPKTMDQSRPRVDIERRLVLVHSPKLGSFHLYSITAAGGVAKSPAERATVRDTPQEACKALEVPFARFQAINGMNGLKFRSAAEQVVAIWKEAQKQLVTPGAEPVPTTPDDMATKKKSEPKKAAKAAPKKRTIAVQTGLGKSERQPKAPKAAVPMKEGMSGLDAAAHVLKAAGKALNAKEVLAAIQEDNLAPGLTGKTPHATLYAGMITEMAKKGKESRFARGKEKGTFEYAGA